MNELKPAQRVVVLPDLANLSGRRGTIEYPSGLWAGFWLVSLDGDADSPRLFASTELAVS
ncbi:hypothetical protein acdb102_31040 [Acidothermaceae bacterium B102]|nr:hypothetical protein acdb102_31040 [Acidothermaceae bacterium B102]